MAGSARESSGDHGPSQDSLKMRDKESARDGRGPNVHVEGEKSTAVVIH